MGAFYNSICIPGRRPEAVRRSLERWLSGRGYRLSEEPVLFDLDAESERSAFLVWNDRWTVLFFSFWEEERRLIRELQPELAPLIYFWVYDSEVWGYDLFDAEGFAGSYSSDPSTHISFAHELTYREPRPAAEPREVCRQLGLQPELAPEIRRIQKGSAVFKEDLCREVCELLRAGPAVASYDDLETGKLDGRLEGWRKEQKVYYHYDMARSSIEGELDLHSIEREGPMPAELRRLTGSRALEISPELLEEMDQMRRRARLSMWVLRPLSLFARGWRRSREMWNRLTGPAREQHAPSSPITVERTPTATRHEVVNRRHGVRLLLPEGVEPLEVSGKPASVFAFRARGTVVTCTARRLRYLWEVLKPPGRSKTLRDERYRVGPLRARSLFFELPASRFATRPDLRYLGLHVLQTYRALYVFLYRFTGEVDEEAEHLIRTAVESFREEKGARSGRRGPRR